jgi:hypothetical protein
MSLFVIILPVKLHYFPRKDRSQRLRFRYGCPSNKCDLLATTGLAVDQDLQAGDPFYVPFYSNALVWLTKWSQSDACCSSWPNGTAPARWCADLLRFAGTPCCAAARTELVTRTPN